MALGGIRAWAGEDGDGKTLYKMEISRFNLMPCIIQGLYLGRVHDVTRRFSAFERLFPSPLCQYFEPGHGVRG